MARLKWERGRAREWRANTQRFVNPLTIQLAKGTYYILSGGGFFGGSPTVIASGQGKLADAKAHAQRLEDGEA